MQTAPHLKDASSDDVVVVGKAVGDARRADLLRVLQHDSFAVSELARLFGVAQPAISHHLKVLREASLISQRREGNTIFYQRCDPSGSSLTRALFSAIDQHPPSATLRRRIEQVHRDRDKAVQAFFASNADALKSQRKLIAESEVYAGVLQEMWGGRQSHPRRALEVGPGDGRILRLLAEDFDHVLGIDRELQMLTPVRAEVADQKNVSLADQALDALPKDSKFDVIVAAMVLHHQASPQRFFRLAEERLVEGGSLLIAELDQHQHDWAAEACGDLWLGFSQNELDSWALSVQLHPIGRQFLAQRNGFSIHLTHYSKENTQ